MKFVILVISIFSVCSSISIGQEKADLIMSDVPFNATGKVSNEPYTFPDGKATKPYRIEVGSINGIQYRIYYSDGSGTFGNAIRYGTLDPDNNWSVSCKKDAIDDSKYCYMRFHDLSIWKFSSSGYRVSVGGETYPGSEVAVRIDGSPAIIGSKDIFGGPNAEKIIEGLKTGKSVTTRYVRWPAGTNKDDTFELVGFNEAFAYINWALSKIK